MNQKEQDRLAVELRDFFAAHAMQGLIGCTEWREICGEDFGLNVEQPTAIYAYKVADSMMKARDKK
jgi:hypothetical protein